MHRIFTTLFAKVYLMWGMRQKAERKQRDQG